MLFLVSLFQIIFYFKTLDPCFQSISRKAKDLDTRIQSPPIPAPLMTAPGMPQCEKAASNVRALFLVKHSWLEEQEIQFKDSVYRVCSMAQCVQGLADMLGTCAYSFQHFSKVILSGWPFSLSIDVNSKRSLCFFLPLHIFFIYINSITHFCISDEKILCLNNSKAGGLKFQ